MRPASLWTTFWRSTLLSALVTLAGCANSSNLATSLSDFCGVMEPRYPILMSRSDTDKTKRQVAEINSIVEKRCIGPTVARQAGRSPASPRKGVTEEGGEAK